jgi:MurNAc alpha-1-phosphate uridylyltransferase
VGGHSLIEYHLKSLSSAGIRDIVVNVAHLGSQIRDALGNGRRWGVRLAYSQEPAGALETGGGLLKALPLLGDQPFILVNADVWTDFDFSSLGPLEDAALAHLVMVDNPPHHPGGDFVLEQGLLSESGTNRLTYSGIAIINPRLIEGREPGKFPLAPLLRRAMEQGKVTGEHFRGRWEDVGTPERLDGLDARLQASVALGNVD